MFTLGLLGWPPRQLTFQIKERFSTIPQRINSMLLLDIYCTRRITNNSNIITATIGTTLTIMSIKIIPRVFNHRLSHHSKKSSQQLGLLTVDALLPQSWMGTVGKVVAVVCMEMVPQMKVPLQLKMAVMDTMTVV